MTSAGAGTAVRSPGARGSHREKPAASFRESVLETGGMGAATDGLRIDVLDEGADVCDAFGQRVRRQVGETVCRQLVDRLGQTSEPLPVR